MSWAGIFGAGRRPDSAAVPVEKEIDEELMFHLRSLVEDNVAAGMTTDEAWRDAQNRFGSLRHYSEACRRTSAADRLLPLGLAAAGLLAVCLLAGWLLMEVRELRKGQLATIEAKAIESQTLAAIRAEVAAVTSRSAPASGGPAPIDRSDLAGRVLDHEGKPIDGAAVFVILKTWPDDRFRQQAFFATSDGEGGFRLPDLIPAEGQVGLLVAALKDGHALTSTYQLREDGNRIETDELTLRLDDAPRLTLVVQDNQGRPVPNARVLPSSRQSTDGENHMLYFQGSEPLQAEADAEGRVGLGCFERGDEAEIYVRLPGDDWRLRTVRIPSEGDVVTLSANEPKYVPPPLPDPGTASRS